MTPKQRLVLVDLQNKTFKLERYIRRLHRQMDTLAGCFAVNSASYNADFTATEINELLQFNERLAKLELHLCDLGKKECLRLDSLVADPNNPMDDYEIEATLYFTLREDDPEFDEEDDNFLSQRDISLKHLDLRQGLGDGHDHHDTILPFPVELTEMPHCWLFYDLYDHSYGLEQPRLSLYDCLRVGSIWVDVAVRHQATLDINTGEWQQPLNNSDTISD